MKLKNTYYLIRHGHSVANEKNIIISLPEEGIKPEWGLTDLGAAQADSAGEELIQMFGEDWNPNHTVICTSPFSRCIETAARIASHMDIHLHDARMRRSDALRERYFGAALEGASSSLYRTVWEQDEKDSTAIPEGGGESVADVAARLRQFLYEVEDSLEGQNVVIVSHGDSLSILISLILEEDLRYHWNIGLKNCQIYRIDPTR